MIDYLFQDGHLLNESGGMLCAVRVKTRPGEPNRGSILPDSDRALDKHQTYALSIGGLTRAIVLSFKFPFGPLSYWFEVR